MIQQNNPLQLSIAVPTDDKIVVRQLRQIHEPAKYFAEGPAERRQRLAKHLVDLKPEERLRLQQSTTNDNSILDNDSRLEDETFYYEGIEALRAARYDIANFSIQQSNYRLDMARIRQLEPAASRLAQKQDLIEKVRQIDDPETHVDKGTSATESKILTSCSFNSDATYVVTSSRSGRCKIWSVPEMDECIVFRGHQQSANFITFSPKSGSKPTSLPKSVANIASCSRDGSVALWNLIQANPVAILSEAQNCLVSRVRYHPSGRYLASCCSDKSWRLLDIETKQELLHQEGHADGVFDMGFHPDGSLACSAGLDSYGRVWDLRTGRAILSLDGHSKGLRCVDISPNGYHIATGSLDNTVKIWNLRQRKLEYTIPAHLNAVTTVIFDKENGYYLATASFDKSVKFWATKTWAPIKTLDAYEDKVAHIDVSSDSRYLISCYSKYLKLWTSHWTEKRTEVGGAADVDMYD